MLRKVLIVEDNAMNRQLLHAILRREYDVLEARDGEEALSILHRKYKMISAVLLDLAMPVLDGFEVLRKMRDNAVLSQIPVIVATGSADEDAEVKALSLGANDFIAKPYNPMLILHCLRNNINLRETASIVNAIQRDKLTGLYNREAFFEKAGALLREQPGGYYILSCFDINNFKLINDQYGAAEGDRILRLIGQTTQVEMAAVNGIASRISADNFAALYPAAQRDIDFITRLQGDKQFTPPALRAATAFSVGRYVVTDPALPVSAIYDRAYIAKQSVKGRYDTHIAYFDEPMLERLVREQEIIGEMDYALDHRQFEVWFQPQYNHSSGALVGAEALVRWRHPQKGLVPPGVFIPVFEQNGFIYELDKFVWEEACRYLRKWIDAGRRPLPVSVNISRYDIFRADLTDVITGLVEKYAIPVELLRLEITESAFARSGEQIIAVVRQLVDRGFIMEIDDFGSGYSSLNTLKDVPAQILKLDMRFLESSGNSQRGGNILESIVRMAKWLNMTVIAEGVETQDQADFLGSIGCSYLQGYFYARPMPAESYEALAGQAGKEDRLFSLKTFGNLDNNAFWDPASMDTLIFNSYVGGACIFEYHGGRIELLRATEKFARILGGSGITVEDALKLDWAELLEPESLESMAASLRQSIETGEEVCGDYVFLDLPGCPHKTYLRSTMRVIASAEDRYLVYSTSENMTAQRTAERKERMLSEQLQAILDDVGSGITAGVAEGDGIRLLLSNERYFALLGFDRAQFEAEVPDFFALICPEDRERVRGAVLSACREERAATVEYRVLRRDGAERWMRCTLSSSRFTGFDQPVQLCVMTDITDERRTERELLDNMPCGAALYELSGETLTLIHLNNRYRELIGRQVTDLSNLSALDSVHPDDRTALMAETQLAIRESRDADCEIRILCGEKRYRRFRVLGRIVPRQDGKYAIYAAYTPIGGQEPSYQEMLPVALRAVMRSFTDLAYVKDRSLRYICASQTFLQFVGAGCEEDVVGRTDADFVSPQRASRFRAVDEEILSSGKARLDYEEILPSPDGSVRYVNTSKYPLLDGDGAVIGIYCLTRDVTESHAALDRLALLTNSIPGGIATFEVCGQETRLTYFNDGFYAYTGYTREEYVQKSRKDLLFLIHREDLPAARAAFDAVRKGCDQLPACAYRCRMKNGKYRWFSMKGTVTARRDGTATVNTVQFDITERKATEERLRLGEEQFRIAAALGDRTVTRYNIKTDTFYNDSELLLRQGIQREMKNAFRTFVDGGNVDPESLPEFQALYEKIRSGVHSAAATVALRVPDGAFRWFRLESTTIRDSSGQPDQAILVFCDVTEQREKEAVYKRWQQSLQAKAPESYTFFRCNLSKNASFDLVEGSLLQVRFEPGSASFDQRTMEYVEQFVHPDDRAAYLATLNSDTLLANYYRGKRSETLDFRESPPGGQVRWLRRTVELLEYPDSTDVLAYLMFENIDGQKREELQTRAQARTDPLTGVLNRTAFADEVERLIGARTGDVLCALVMLDIDGFKLLNDRFGHAAGDQTLVELAGALRSAVRQEDLVGRLGGDEFLVFLREMPGRAAIAGKARQLCGAVRRSLNPEVQVSASFGVAVCPEDGADFKTLYRRADLALYHVKAAGKDNYAFYRPEMDGEPSRPEEPAQADGPRQAAEAVHQRRMLIVDDDRIGRELLVHLFQQEFLIDTAANGAEALIRMRRSGGELSVVLLDLMMPGMDGFAVLEKMRSSPEMRSIPVVVVSGSDEREASLRTIRCGASDYVTKPVDPDLLRLRVQSAVSKAENDRLRAQNSYLALQSSETARYRAVLEHDGTAMAEEDCADGSFSYDPALSRHLAGTFDSRPLWRLLSEDRVAAPGEIERMQALERSVAADPQGGAGSITALLRTPSGAERPFLVKIFRHTDPLRPGGRLLLTFTERGGAPSG